jgi:hypothetical protein
MRARLRRLARRLPPLACAFAAAAAHAQVIVPTQAQICDERAVVDKRRLATFLLDSVPVSRRLEDWAAANPGQFQGLSPRERMLVDGAICAPVAGKPPAHCAATDAANLAAARHVLISLLSRQPGSYRNVTGVKDPGAYFATPGAQLECVRNEAGQPVEVAGAVRDKFDLKLPVRLRGSADGIHFARTDAPFKAQEKATISFTHDYEKDKRSEKFAVVLGYPFALLDTAARTAEIVPYVGLSRDVAKVAETEPTVTADLWRVGAVLDYTLTANEMTHWFVARPEFLLNDKENSQLLGMTLTYVPVINNGLNSYRYLIPGNDAFISWQAILDFRLVAGHFLEQGTRTDEASRDFLRFGGQVGISLSSDVIAFPADLTLTKIYLPALAGSADDLSYFKAVLALGIDKDRLFGVDISYVDGKREDLLDKERSWTIGFGMKF